MNKKGFSWLAITIISFAIISVMYLFSVVLIYETGEEYLIAETADAAIEILNTSTSEQVSTPGIAKVNEIKDDYSNLVLPYDLFFLLMWMLAFSSTIFAAWMQPKEGVFGFFGWIFVGSLILLLITVYVEGFTTWFMTEVYTPVFSDSNINTPILDFYLSNLPIINLFWWVILLLVNIIDRSFISKTGEVEQ